MVEPLIVAQNLEKTYETRGLFQRSSVRALDGVSLTLYPGEVVALIGESGSGKTTLGKALLRLLSLDKTRKSDPRDNTVTCHFGEQSFDLFSISNRELRKARRHFQMIFQNPLANLHPRRTVMEMLDESLRLHQPGLDAAARQQESLKLLQRVGLPHLKDVCPGRLSGGERRRIGLARILATKAQFIVADEPTSGLDASLKLQMIDLLQDLKGDSTYLLISHDLGLVRRIATRIVVMLRGRIIEESPAEEFWRNGPRHPYTERLLKASELFDHLGRHDLDDALRPAELALGADSEEKIALSGCVYAGDCKRGAALGILNHCRCQRPPLESGVACFAVNATKEP